MGLSQVGEVWDGYTVTGVVGPRGMAERYEARGPDGRRVWLDILAVHHPDLVSRLRSSGVLNLSHPSLLAVHDVIGVLRFPALVLEASDGVPLEEWLAGDPPIDERLTVFRTIVEALTVLHAQGLAHGNLQPDVIVVEDSPALVRARIALPGVASVVFSLVREGGTVSTSGAALGRPEFLAPERARMPELADTRADMFALGCLLYLVFVGHGPFHGLDRFECYKAARAERYTPLELAAPHAPPEMVELCRRLLRSDPDERMQHCGQVITRLEATGVTSSGSRPVPRHSAPAVPPPRAVGPAAIVGAVGVVGAVLGVAAWWWFV